MRKLLIATASLGLILGTALSATADHSGNPNTENLEHVSTAGSGETACGSASVLITVPDDTPIAWQYGLTADVNGELTIGPVQVGPGQSSLDLTFEEDENDGLVTVNYYFAAASEWDLVAPDMNYQFTYPDGIKSRSFDVITDCVEPEPEPTETPAPTEEPTKTPEPEVTEEPEPTKEAVPTEIPAGKELPKTGVPVALSLIATGLIAFGGIVTWLARRKLFNG